MNYSRLAHVFEAEQYYKDIASAQEGILKKIELIKLVCITSLSHLKVIKTTLNNLNELPNDVEANKAIKFEDFCSKYTISSEPLSEEEQESLSKHLKNQQTALLKEIYLSLQNVLNIINYPEHKNYLFNPNKDWEECIDVAISDLEELISNNKLFNHKPKKLFLKGYNEDYFINHVDKIKEFGKGITYPMREIRRIIEI